MENVIIKEVEKIVEKSPPVAPTKNGSVISLEFAKQMECFDYTINNDDIIINKVLKGKEYLTIPMGVTIIGKGAFSGEYVDMLQTKIKRITIPESVYEIQDEAFAMNSYIESVNMEHSSVLTIGDNAFNCCRKLYHILLPRCLNEIGNGALRNTAIKEIFVPRHTKLGNNVFDDKTMYLRGNSAFRDLLVEEYNNTVLKVKEFEEEKTQFINEQEKRKQNAINMLIGIKSTAKEEFRKNKQNEIKHKNNMLNILEEQLRREQQVCQETIRGYYNLIYCIMNCKLSWQDLRFSYPYSAYTIRKHFENKIESGVDVFSFNYTEKQIEEQLTQLANERKKDIGEPFEIKDESGNTVNIVVKRNEIEVKNSCNNLGQEFVEFISPEITTLIFTQNIPTINCSESVLKNIVSIKVKSAKEISSLGAQKFQNLENLILLDYIILTISQNCFVNNQKLKTVKMGAKAGQVIINQNAFNGLENLEDFNFEDVTNIGSNAFQNCKKLKDINSNKMQFINPEAFNGCENLEQVNLQKCSKLKVFENSFTGCNNIKKINLHKSAEIFDKTLLNFGKNQRKLEVKSTEKTSQQTTKKVEENTKTQNIQVNKEKEINNFEQFKIGTQVLDEQNDKIIVLKAKTIEFVGEYKFEELPKEFFESLKKVNTIAFNYVLPNWKTDCKTFKKINNIIIKNVAIVNRENVSVFEYVENIEISGAKNVEINECCFKDNIKLKKVNILTNCGNVIIKNEALQGLKNLQDFNFADVKTIGVRSFENCQNLSSLIKSKHLECVSNGAFANCKKLTKVEALNKDLIVKSNAFSGCNKLNSVSVNKPLGRKKDIEDQTIQKLMK